MAQAAVMLSPNLRMIHPSVTGYCGKADFEKKCLVKSTAGTWEAADSVQPTAGKEAETHHGQSPGEQQLTSPSWILYHFIYSTQLSIALHVKTANSSGNKQVFPIRKRYNETC